MPANDITDLRAPTLSVNGDYVTFSDSWRNTWNGGEEFKNMDCVWKLNGDQGLGTSHHGDGEKESDDYTTPRSRFYPLSSLVLSTVHCDIRGVFEGAGRWGSFRSTPRLSIARPNPPKVELSIAAEGGIDYLKCSVTPDDGTEMRESHGTDVYVEVWRSWEGYGPARTTHHVYAENSKASENHNPFEWKAKVSDIEDGLQYGLERYILVRATAYSKGLAGDGGKTTVERVFAHPMNPAITSVNKASDIVLVAVNPNETKHHPVESMWLEQLRDKCATVAEAATWANDGDWAKVGEESNGSTRGFCVTKASVTPTERGKDTFLRVVSSYDGHERVSAPVALGLMRPPLSITAGAAYVASAVSGDDGESAIVDVAWYDDSASDATPSELAAYERSTEISWGKADYVWESTGGASKFDCDWENPELLAAINAARPSGTSAYQHCARVYVSGLTEGEPVYVRARRKFANGSDVVYGKYSNTAVTTPVSAPAWVRLDAPAYVARGKSIPLSWTFGSDAEQTGWMVTDEDGMGLAEGRDANGYCLIDTSAIPADVTTVKLRVAVTTGGLWVNSEYREVVIADAPTCTVSVEDVLTALPLSVSVESSATAALSIVSRGVTYAAPEGMKTQHAGDVVWTGKTTGGTVEIADADLRNGCAYEVRAIARDAETGLRSEVAIGTFTVELERHAGIPSATIAADSVRRWASITPVAPQGAMIGDVCDVYRLTQDGACPIATGVAYGSTVTDRFAPYSTGGQLSYRICDRTSDGDLLWRDVDYSLRAGGLRLDWGDSHVELPYNVATSEAFKKAFEARTHMDGKREGNWDAGTERTASVTTDLIKLGSDEQRRLVRDMARHEGPVFVRTGSGLAFEADVELESVVETYESGAIAVSLEITEIALTAEHACAATDIASPEAGS